MHQSFINELIDSGYLMKPLPLHREKSLEASFVHKNILLSKVLFNKENCVYPVKAGGIASLEQTKDQLIMRAPLRMDHWPEGAAPDGDYSNFGTAKIIMSFQGEDWQEYNRLRFTVHPYIRGARIMHAAAAIVNKGATPIPDPYGREGSTIFDLENDKEQECIWEFAAMPRDAVTELTLYVLCSGHDISAGEELTYCFSELVLEKVEQPEHELGWVNPNEGIRLSSVGYWPDGRKTAIATTEETMFSVINVHSKETVYTGKIETVENERGTFKVLDFSEVTVCGDYILQVGDIQSAPFEIAEDLAKESLWKVLNYIFCERCGFPVPGKHGTCHEDILGTHNGVTLSFHGGWHDAGDVSQQSAQTAEIVMSLLENAAKVKDDRMLYLRLMSEAQWGLDFILKTRFGDGYRLTSAGATRITDNKMGNMDDVAARVFNHSFENFLFAGVEAMSADSLKELDPQLSLNALKAAEEDYGFAMERFLETGVEPAHMYEHTYNSGLSQYYAVLIWASSMLYKVTQKASYAKDARAYADKLMQCQETGTEGVPMKGFFYRDETHETIVHFNHQARDHQFMQALVLLCETQREHPDRVLWEKSMTLYGEYLKGLMENTAPYGMIPAGIHKMSEVEERELFPYLHVTCSYDMEKENYRQQLLQGKDLGNGYVLKNFPIWFSFRGNGAVALSTGKAASLIGKYLGDKELKEIAREQMYWMWGKNPFGQSLIYGTGSNYCRQYAVLCGECTGEIPVGIETLDNQDIPYWPQNNNATFREVWVGSASRWLMLCADCL